MGVADWLNDIFEVKRKSEAELLDQAKKVLESSFIFSYIELLHPEYLPKVVNRNLRDWEEFEALERFMTWAGYEMVGKKVTNGKFVVHIYAEFICKTYKFDLEMERLLLGE